MKASLILAVVILSSSLYAQESVPDRLAYTDPPTSKDDRPGQLLDKSFNLLLFEVHHSPLNTTATPVGKWTDNERPSTSEGQPKQGSGVSSTFASEKPRLALLVALNRGQYGPYYKYFLEEGGLRLPLAW